VAMTRAKEVLYLSYAKNRKIYGKTEKRKPTHFLTGIEENLITIEAVDSYKKKKKKHQQLNLFNEE
jgi:DNA helicase-2/ATP-dependent DNA helicase PcrA